MRLLLVFTSFALLSFAAGDLNFSQATSIIDQIKEGIIPVIAGLCGLSIIICGYLYITGKGNVAKETLINIMIGSIIVGIAGTLSSLLFGL